MKAYGYAATKPARIVGKIWSEGMKNLRKGNPDLFPLNLEFSMLPNIQSAADKLGSEADVKVLLCKPAAPTKRLGAFMPAGGPDIEGPSKMLGVSNVAALPRLPNPASFALQTPAGFKESFRAGEHKGKSRRIAVLLSPLRFTNEPSQQRFVSYHDFVKWELSSYLDDNVTNFNVHILSWADTPDAEYDAQDLSLRIRRTHSTYLHKIEKYDELASMVSNAHRFITDDRNLALLARGLGKQVAFLSDSYASEDPDAALLGPGYLEPYTFCAETLRRRFEALNDWKVDPKLVEANKKAASAIFASASKIFAC
ncbi:hypothetical protein IAI18_11750 [Acetobacteraceae bacterium H6797]|nr:hypothetical protein [Acetobacteraceae bacterium H6797]